MIYVDVKFMLFFLAFWSKFDFLLQGKIISQKRKLFNREAVPTTFKFVLIYRDKSEINWNLEQVENIPLQIVLGLIFSTFSSVDILQRL